MNWVIASVLIAGLLPVVCAGIAKWGARGYDNHQPREWLTAQTGHRARANNAQANSLEAFPLYAVGVILAMLSGVEVITLQVVAALFVVARLVYIYCYVSDRATLRSLVWMVGFGASLSLYVSAIRAL
ncbi:MAG: hypothetical protein RL111_1435 [Pseudomonadota bacterium]|jgi:uncharacterized MAPEG superfamily protein